MFSRLKEVLVLDGSEVQKSKILVLNEDQAELVDWMMMTLQAPQGAENYFVRQDNGKPAELVVPNANSLKIWKNVLDCYSRGLVPRIVVSELFHFEGEDLVYSTICFDSDRS